MPPSPSTRVLIGWYRVPAFPRSRVPGSSTKSESSGGRTAAAVAAGRSRRTGPAPSAPDRTRRPTSTAAPWLNPTGSRRGSDRTSRPAEADRSSRSTGPETRTSIWPYRRSPDIPPCSLCTPGTDPAPRRGAGPRGPAGAARRTTLRAAGSPVLAWSALPPGSPCTRDTSYPLKSCGRPRGRCTVPPMPPFRHRGTSQSKWAPAASGTPFQTAATRRSVGRRQSCPGSAARAGRTPA